MTKNSQPHEGGMACPKCSARDTIVKDSRPSHGGVAIRRRRACVECSERFTTHETTKRDVPVVVFPNGVVVELSIDAIGRRLADQMAGRFVDELWEAMRKADVVTR